MRNGANSNEQTSDGQGAIHLASKKGFVEILRCLLEKTKTAVDMQDKVCHSKVLYLIITRSANQLFPTFSIMGSGHYTHHLHANMFASVHEYIILFYLQLMKRTFRSNCFVFVFTKL